MLSFRILKTGNWSGFVCFVLFFHQHFKLKVFGFGTSILKEFFFFLLEKECWRKKVLVIFVHIYICDQWMERELFSHGKLEMKWLYEKFHFIKRKCFVKLVLTSCTSVDSSRSWYKGIIFKRVETPTINMVLPIWFCVGQIYNYFEMWKPLSHLPWCKPHCVRSS